jgi:hypothetical protein
MLFACNNGDRYELRGGCYAWTTEDSERKIPGMLLSSQILMSEIQENREISR